MRLARVAMIAALLLTGCGGEERAAEPEPEPTVAATPAPAQTPAPSPRVARAHCAAGGSNCAAVTGRVLYVEAVDPDGDGDAHYVLLAGDVTAPGLTIVDVSPALRPQRLPRRGELVSAAGPVFTGSHGQHQIEAVEVHHQRPRP